MLVGRCAWELSGRKLQRKIKKVTNSERSRGIRGSTDLSWECFSLATLSNPISHVPSPLSKEPTSREVWIIEGKY
jgi:hypothetical protein